MLAAACAQVDLKPGIYVATAFLHKHPLYTKNNCSEPLPPPPPVPRPPQGIPFPFLKVGVGWQWRCTLHHSLRQQGNEVAVIFACVFFVVTMTMVARATTDHITPGERPELRAKAMIILRSV